MSRLSGYFAEFTSPSGFASLADTTMKSTDVSVPGARVGDFVLVSTEATGDSIEYVLSGVVTADDNVKVQIFPDAGGGGMTTGTVCRVKVIPVGAI